MAKQNVKHQFEEKQSQALIKALLEDFRDLEFLVENYCAEILVTRLAPEQQMSDRDHATG